MAKRSRSLSCNTADPFAIEVRQMILGGFILYLRARVCVCVLVGF